MIFFDFSIFLHHCRNDNNDDCWLCQHKKFDHITSPQEDLTQDLVNCFTVTQKIFCYLILENMHWMLQFRILIRIATLNFIENVGKDVPIFN